MKDLRTSSSISNLAIESIISQSDALKKVASSIDSSFDDAVKLIHKSKGRVIITGIGKSAIIASKIVATLNSTGTPSIFMHAADAIHGDLGLVQENDIIICISKSGNTPEIKVLLNILKRLNNKLIAITGNLKSSLASNADYIFNSYVEKEVCPNNLAPTTSTTAQLVIGDALAICLLNLKNSPKMILQNITPGGSLGKNYFSQ